MKRRLAILLAVLVAAAGATSSVGTSSTGGPSPTPRGIKDGG